MIRQRENGENELGLVNIFESINGEAYASGKPTVFIRTFGCNLRCGFCFAKDQNGNYPYVVTKEGKLLHLNEINIGDEILTKDPETNKTFTTRVTNITSREADPKTIRAVSFGKVGRSSFNVTEEHPFYTNKWVAIKDIKEGERVKRTTNANLVKYLVETEYKNLLCLYAKKAYDCYVNNHKNQPNFGSKNGSFKKECKERTFQYVKNGLIEMDTSDYPLKELWGNDKLVVHHLDGNHLNDTLDNMVIVPKRIHDQLHGRGYNFSKNNSADSIEVTSNKIRRINRKYGSTVINIETEAHSYYVKSNEHSFEYILVHNCDTAESWTENNLLKVYPERTSFKDPIKWKTAKEIFDEVEEIETDYLHKSICLTGGEPLMECNKDFMLNELIPLFVNAHYDVGIETDGGIDYADYKKKFGDPIIEPATGARIGVTLIADYKLPCSGMTHKMIKSNFDIYSKHDIVKMVISDNEEDWKELDWVVNESETKACIYLSPCFGKVTMSRIPEYVIAHPDKEIKAQIQAHKVFWDFNKKDV